ncbi:MAG: DUF4150 domain-containing protein [Pelistega sp.]|nr:DUF4150 domain-containing protein [Pelistega sp.]
MLATSQKLGLDLAFPDICKTPPAAVPIPYPNLAVPMTAIPVAVRIFYSGAFAHNLATKIPASLGDQAGAMMGLVSQSVGSSSRRLLLNSYTTLVFGTPANRWLAMGPQNRINTVGATVAPSPSKIRITAP